MSVLKTLVNVSVKRKIRVQNISLFFIIVYIIGLNCNWLFENLLSPLFLPRLCLGYAVYIKVKVKLKNNTKNI